MILHKSFWFGAFEYSCVMLNIFVETMMLFFNFFFRFIWWLQNWKEQNLFKKTIFLNIIHVFTVTFNYLIQQGHLKWINHFQKWILLTSHLSRKHWCLDLSVRLRELNTNMMMVWPHHFLLPFWDDVTWLSVASRSAGLSEMKQRETAHGS